MRKYINSATEQNETNFTILLRHQQQPTWRSTRHTISAGNA